MAKRERPKRYDVVERKDVARVVRAYAKAVKALLAAREDLECINDERNHPEDWTCNTLWGVQSLRELEDYAEELGRTFTLADFHGPDE